MKNLIALLMIFSLLTACVGSIDEAIDEAANESQVFNEQDEEARQLIYRYFGDIFYFDKPTGQKSQLEAAYGVSTEAISFEDFSLNYKNVIAGNILGVKKLEENKYQVNLVIFYDEGADEYIYELTVSDGGEDLVIEKTDLVTRSKVLFEEESVVESKISPSGKYTAVLMKQLAPVLFYTVEDVEVPGYLGRYELFIDDGDGRRLVDYSFDPFSTNLPFEIWRFSENEKYLEYYEQGLGRLFNMYDIERSERTDIEIGGILDKSFWVNDSLVVCTAGGDIAPIIAIATAPNWKITDQEFVFPAELNDLDEESVWEFLVSWNPEIASLNCELDQTTLLYNEVDGKLEKFDLSGTLL